MSKKHFSFEGADNVSRDCMKNCAILFRYFVFFLPFFLIGCAPFAPEQRNATDLFTNTMPTQYSNVLNQVTNVKDSASTKPWWNSFKNQELNTLMETVLANNFDIMTAWARLRQSQATLDQATAGFFPSLDFDSGATHQRRSTQNSSNASRTQTTSDTFNLGLAAAYEVDLWGRVSSDHAAEELRTQASANDVQTAIMTITASVADTWVQLLGNRAERAVLDRQIETNEDLVQLQRVRFSNGISSGLEVLQQQELLASVEAEVPALEQSATVLRNQLAVLQGTLPNTGLIFDESAPLPSIPSVPNVGLPIDLLDARPDVRAAWARLAAADWDVSVAHANRYPALRLTAAGAFGAAEASVLFGNWVTTLAASLVMPIFDGGALAAQETAQRAAADIQAQSYAKTVATAIQEVDDALATESGETQRLQRLQDQMRLAEAALTEARNSYLGGVLPFLNYITQLKSVQTLERNIARQKTTVLQARITLYRSLGALTMPELFSSFSEEDDTYGGLPSQPTLVSQGKSM